MAVPQDKASAVSSAPDAPARVFTVESANQALVLVGRIVADVVRRYAELSDLRRERDTLAEQRDAQERLQDVGERLAYCVEELNALNRELLSVGCVLKDWRTGLVDFPALRRGRRVLLCWRLGEPRVEHWHELREGYAGRRAIDF